MVNTNYLQMLISNGVVRKSELISKSGLSKGTIEAFLKGADIKISTLEAIARVLKLPLSKFFDEAEDANQHKKQEVPGEYISAKELLAEKDKRIAELQDTISILKEQIEFLKSK